MDVFVFDLDGTLLDTLGDLSASVNFALRQTGQPERTVDEVRAFVGNGVAKLMERAVPGGRGNARFGEALAAFKDHYSMHGLDTTRPYPGVVEMLGALRSMGKQVAVVSNKYDAATKALCRHFFHGLIDVAIGEREEEGVRKKPAPDTVLEALRLLGARCSEAVYVGDSDVDVLTARNCGMPCVSVLWGFRDREFLTGFGAKVFVGKPSELVQLAEKSTRI